MVKSTTQRLNNIIGQIEGVKKMLSRNSECMDVLVQLKAIRSAIGGVMDAVTETEIDNCMAKMDSGDKTLLVKLKKYIKN